MAPLFIRLRVTKVGTTARNGFVEATATNLEGTARFTVPVSADDPPKVGDLINVRSSAGDPDEPEDE